MSLLPLEPPSHLLPIQPHCVITEPPLSFLYCIATPLASCLHMVVCMFQCYFLN